MRARNCLCTLTVSALAFTVAAYAAPRDVAAEGKGKVRSESSRLLTGADAQLRDAAGGVATQGNPYYRLAPVTGPLDGDSVVNTAAGTVTISLPADHKVYLEMRLDGWGGVEDGTLKTVQGQVDSASFTSGSGAPVANAVVACAGTPDCQAAYTAAAISSFTFCNAGTCENAYQENTRADFPFPGAQGVSACSLATADRQCGSTALAAPIADGAGEAYVGTVVLNVPAGAAGTYTIDLLPLGTFMQSGNNNVPPLAKLTPAQIIIPTGRCCFGIGTPGAGCDDGLTQAECNTRPSPRLPVDSGATCAEGCAECTTDAQCTDEAGACTTSVCIQQTLTCQHTPIPGYVPGGANCCNPANGQQAPRADADPCTTDTCTVNDAASLGVPNHSPASDGTECDDDNPCTAADACTGGLCNGHNVNGDPCTTDADCTNGGSTPGAVCDGGLCSCTLEPDLTFEKVDPPANNCYAEGEKITVAVHVGPAANTINGGQFAITYDNTCLDFNSISVAPGPYSNVIMQNVNEGAGTIFFAVGVQLGGVGVQGNSDMALISFTKLGNCDECVLCFTDVNPIHTYLTDDTGQPIGVNESCSKPIRLLPEITLDGPESVKVNTGCDSSNADVTWDAPSASSTCGGVTLECVGEHVESGTILDNTCLGGTRNGLPCVSQAQCPAGQCLPGPMGGGTFPIGNSNFCCVAGNDTCGGTLEHCWTVTVNDETSLDVEIQLSPTMVTKPGGGIIRCIKFEVFSNCIQAPLVFEEDMSFGGLFDLVGHFTGFVKIPSAVQPECITARDQLHTLRSCYSFGDGDCVDGILNASFKGDPFFGGNWLVGGNLDGWKKDNPASSHDVIDILDFGSIVAEWLATYDSNGDSIPDGNTPCGVFDSTHADINGDGLVDLLDYSFISMNFLEDSKDCCCPGSSSLGNTIGRTEISVRELFETGQGDLAVADLNADGTVNLADMAALMQGVRPAQKPADRGGKDSGTRSFNKR